ncbi:MAG TPA: OB-fold domain-containing protein [Acidimicrobiales bacterium]
MTAAATVPIAPGLFTWPSDEPQLIGSRCRECGLMAFPSVAACPRCSGATDEALFARRGTLWTFTTQGFVPKSPPYALVETEESFVPYAVGYIELPGEARIEGRIVGCVPEDLRIGMEMEVVVVPFMVDENGTEVVTYAFRPLA